MKIMQKTITAIVGLAMLAFLGVTAIAIAESPGLNDQEAQQRLLEGNKRFVDEKVLHPNQTPQRRKEISKAQYPFAVIIGCADSRVPPEVIFDQGLGDLFVIRVAGNIIDDVVLASLEYAVEHIGVRYIMVLGHEQCGAVDATIKGGRLSGHIGTLAEAIKPALETAKSKPGDLLDNTVRSNVALVVRQIKHSVPILSELVDKGALTVVGARYDLDSGVVEILP